MDDYFKDLWANAHQVTKKDRRKVVTKHDIMSALYKRAEHQGAVLSIQVPIHCSLLIQDYLKDLALFDEVLEELCQEYHGAVLSNEVPTWSSAEMDYLKALWATVRQVTKKKRRKVVTKHDVMSALYKRAEYQGAAP
ncbi:hypothetical protein CEXT_610211 [Caerostris extrusa]|uniref:Transposase n=1 Tax=Caerostris extrusa TaxID=172846 RepID=A0AAV4XZE4_CAEEX|nr:hypothetical protein CEXT_610211 [Caerostris extrusa]